MVRTDPLSLLAEVCTTTYAPPPLYRSELPEAENGVNIVGNLWMPKFIPVEEPNPDYTPVVDVDSDKFKAVPTHFQVSEFNVGGNRVAVAPTTQVMVFQYFPYNFVKTIVDSSNQNCCILKEKIPNLICWRCNIYSAPFTITCVYQFLAILYYFGIVLFPTKEDYWSSERYMPHHPLL